MGVSNPSPDLELDYAEITSTQSTSSTVYADVPGWTITVTARDRPFTVKAWTTWDSTDTAATGGAKYRLVRTDTGATIAQCEHDTAAANGPVPLFDLKRRVSATPGSEIAFKVQIGARIAGTATFNASTDMPLCIRAKEFQN